MKLLGIFLSFSLVGQVLVTELDKYIEEVILTNEDIKQAKNFMPEIIKSMVENYDVYKMETMALMLSVPEILDVELKGPESSSDSDDYYTDSEENIDNMEEPGPSQNQIPDLNIDPFTVPEEEILNPNSAGKTIIHLQKKLKYQKMMQLAILAVTDRRKYQEAMQAAKPDTVPILSLDLNRPPNSDKTRIDAPTIKLDNLASVLYERRRHPRAVSRNRIIRAFNLTTLGKARREMTLEAITSLIRQNDPVFQDLFNMCRLAGLFRTIKYPHSYIATATIDGEYCVLMDVLELEGFVYKFHNGVFWEVDIDHRTLTKPFFSELQ
ncbi:uncharacterized protein LOC126838011 [Adelges cooleyi]|uniref:uncharacterized protein LOC126838011 n=1 Tax=Adelges cooleyi TaxID=133065 RepID=UPI002180212A|nr:uncharacterized protein LOC126838011 [Adelges cooleyi]